jgi:alkylation response protein AidB-like acyl-CoA dehydrogenase
MSALNEITLEYLKTRKQFGVPIGKFQALQHRMADMVIATEQARSMAMMAAVKADSDDAAERRRADLRRQGLHRCQSGAFRRPAGGAAARRHGRGGRAQRRRTGSSA